MIPVCRYKCRAELRENQMLQMLRPNRAGACNDVQPVFRRMLLKNMQNTVGGCAVFVFQNDQCFNRADRVRQKTNSAGCYRTQQTDMYPAVRSALSQIPFGKRTPQLFRF